MNLFSPHILVLVSLLYFLACSCLQPSEAHRTKCLSLALADILWRAGGHEKALVAL